jgi:Lectin C-type domain
VHQPPKLLGMCLALTACFNPIYPEGSPCTDSCPGDLICVNERCTRGDGDGGDAEIDTGLDAAASCPPSYVKNTRTGSFYRIVGTTASWTAAVTDCADDGAGTYLTIPDDLAESNELDRLANNDSWIGITDAAMEETWVTVLGAAQTFTRWAPGPPQQPDGGTLENCAFVQNAAWQDVNCALTKPYICECR